MKPSLGRTVYCIYEDSINKEEVGYLGRDSFIVDDFCSMRRFDSLEYFYEEYQHSWFTSLARAKKSLLAKQYAKDDSREYAIVKKCDDYWEIVKKEIK